MEATQSAEIPFHITGKQETFGATLQLGVDVSGGFHDDQIGSGPSFQCVCQSGPLITGLTKRSPTFVLMHRGAYLVGIAGGSGSGKTSLVRALRERLPLGSVCVVSQDDYYHPKEEQAIDPNGKVNFDLPTAVDLDGLARDLRSLVAGEPIYKKEYTFNQGDKEPALIELRPAPVILVEGLFVLHHEPVRELFDLRVFIDASEGAQLDRRLLRDSRERGYGADEILYQWEHHVLPAYRNYLLPYRHLCDLHVVNELGFDRAVNVLRDHLRHAAGVVEPISLQGL
jgi:uridine kinase